MRLPRNIRRKFCLLVIIFLGLYLYAYCCPLVKNVTKLIESKNLTVYKKISVENAKINLKHVVVHIDLKRTPLKLSYLKQRLLIMKQLGATGLLMEYEDMFPYEGELAELRNPNSYSKTELLKFLKDCKKNNLEVIPLVQTFGHMQFVLHLDKFRHLRENDTFDDSICPSQIKSLNLIKNMVSQVIRFHASVVPVKNVHIGCDEVYHINLCKRCRKRSLSESMIYLQHIRTVISMVKNITAKTNVLIWDDMLRSMPFSPKNTKAEPVIWDYQFNPSTLRASHFNLYKYHKAFSDIWIASAYKGADGELNILPNIKNRFLNTYTWLNQLIDYKFAGEKNVFNFKGIILTGWSRYDYSKSPVDILPASLPSLILNLLLVSRFKLGYFVDYAKEPKLFYATYLHKKFTTLLGCSIVRLEINNWQSKNITDFDNLFLSHCNFTEWRIYKNIKKYLELDSYINISISNKTDIVRNKKWCVKVAKKIYDTNFALKVAMKLYYTIDFITEYVNDLIFELKDELSVVCKQFLEEN